MLAVIHLSDSFRAVWSDLAAELDVRYAALEASASPSANTLAVIVAAGGEGERALDLLPFASRPHNGVPLYVVGARESHRFAPEAGRRGGARGLLAPPGPRP